jgi:D-inositol-3-phosphate glycosyltransferase
MNVYIGELARAMAARGVQVDVFTGAGGGEPGRALEVTDGYRVVQVDARPPGGDDDLASVVGSFAEGVIRWSKRSGAAYDVVHSHYWLSGWAGVLLGEALGVPFASSFHTLSRVKDANRRPDDPPASLLRLAAESEVIARAGCVVASTPAEAAELIEHYAADPERLCVSPPGVDHTVFSPGDRQTARASLRMGAGPLVLFVGRIQPLKGVDVAIRAFARVGRALPGAGLLVVGGPSGDRGEDEVASLVDLTARLGLADRVRFRDPLPHHAVSDAYRAADVLVVPSRSESFGMVAAEAQACGLPVVAARVGGLAYAVSDGESGYLVDGWDPDDYAESIMAILSDVGAAERLAKGAIDHAEQFSWEATVDRLLELYAGITV